MNNRFLDPQEIKGYEIILSSLEREALAGTWLEHLGHLIGVVASYNPVKETGGGVFKQICYTILNKIVCERKWYRPWYEASFVKAQMSKLPNNCEEMFAYLDRFWDDSDEAGEGGPERGYLMFLISFKSPRYCEFFSIG